MFSGRRLRASFRPQIRHKNLIHLNHAKEPDLSINVCGLVVPINVRNPPPTPPFELDDTENYKMVRWNNGWAVLWLISVGRMEFGISAVWALTNGARVITKKHILPKGYQSGEAVVVMFELHEEDGQAEYLDLDFLVERYDWTTNQEIP